MNVHLAAQLLSKSVATSLEFCSQDVCCVNTVGSYVPPMFVFPRIRMSDRLLVNGPVGAVGFTQKSGWMDSNLFVCWLKRFIEHVKPSSDPAHLALIRWPRQSQDTGSS